MIGRGIGGLCVAATGSAGWTIALLFVCAATEPTDVKSACIMMQEIAFLIVLIVFFFLLPTLFNIGLFGVCRL
jgi:hypothetical protein